MIIPSIHLNGTGRESLLSAVCDAGTACIALLDALAFTAPNGRDYYPQGDASWRQAVREYTARCEAIHKVRAELESLAEGISDG